MAGKVPRIYSRFGDLGQTMLLSGETVEKDDLRVDTYGALDELQSSLGMARALIHDEDLRTMIYSIQVELFTAGAELASTITPREERGDIGKRDVSTLEAKIDGLTEVFGLPRSFVLSGTSPDSAALHVSRSVCRRLERLVVALNRHTGGYEVLIAYFNRLGDLLFVMAWAASVCAAIEKAIQGPGPKKAEARGAL